MRVLLIEDEKRIAKAIQEGLTEEHFMVDVSHTGTEGFDLAVSDLYDAIILDLMLPGMDGVTLCSLLRKKHIHTPILMLTAKSRIEDTVVGFESGADDYLTKPFSFTELVARLRALLRRPRNLSSPILQRGDITLDPKIYEVRQAGKRIHLTRREFSLLEYFMRHPKTVFTKEQLIEHVWEYDATILPNTVEVTIRNLRIKIDSGAKSHIHTIRGFGYTMDKG